MGSEGEGANTHTALCLLIIFLKTSHNLKLRFGTSLVEKSSWNWKRIRRFYPLLLKLLPQPQLRSSELPLVHAAFSASLNLQFQLDFSHRWVCLQLKSLLNGKNAGYTQGLKQQHAKVDGRDAPWVCVNYQTAGESPRMVVIRSRLGTENGMLVINYKSSLSP